MQGYKGVAASVIWAPVVVLFGRNDAGKSNILEAIAWAAGLEASRADPLIGDDEAAVFALVELDELDDEDSLDADLLAALLQIRHVPPLFPYAYPDEPRPESHREQEHWGGSIALSQFPGSLLEWDPASDDEDVSARWFKIGCVGELYSPEDFVHTVGSLDIEERASRAGAGLCERRVGAIDERGSSGLVRAPPRSLSALAVDRLPPARRRPRFRRAAKSAARKRSRPHTA